MCKFTFAKLEWNYLLQFPEYLRAFHVKISFTSFAIFVSLEIILSVFFYFKKIIGKSLVVNENHIQIFNGQVKLQTNDDKTYKPSYQLKKYIKIIKLVNKFSNSLKHVSTAIIYSNRSKRHGKCIVGLNAFLESIKRPRAQFKDTGLHIVRKVLHVNGTGRLVNGWWLPNYVAIMKNGGLCS